MGNQHEKELKHAVFISLHYVAGLLALGLALFYLLSDALPDIDAMLLGSLRVQAPICILLFVAAYLLLSSAREFGSGMRRVTGYTFVALGFVTVWLTLGGSSIGI